jgi:hypothetical protein
VNSSVRQAVKTYMKNFVQRFSRKAQEFTIEDIRRAFPFHDLFFRDEALLAFKLQRSIVTSMGMGFYPEIARLIAGEHAETHLEHLVHVELDNAMCSKVEQIISELRTASRKPDARLEMNEILASTGGSKREVPVIADLFIQHHAGGPLFAELKSPKPNLDVAAESKKKMLYFRAFREVQGDANARAVFALPYNPYVERSKYDWWPTLQIMDMTADVVIGEELWDLIGGAGTYDELLRIISEVKAEAPLARVD